MIWVLIDVISNPEAAVLTYNSQKNEVFIKDFFSKCGQIPVNATKSAGTFAEEIFNGKLGRMFQTRNICWKLINPPKITLVSFTDRTFFFSEKCVLVKANDLTEKFLFHYTSKFSHISTYFSKLLCYLFSFSIKEKL